MKLLASLFLGAVLFFSLFLIAPRSTSAAPCDGNSNPIVCENSKPGNPFSEWGPRGYGDPSILGFTTDVSYNKGETAGFKIKTDSSSYHIDIYRLGYYNNSGARKIATISPSVSLPQTQPECITDASVGLYDCGNWAVSASWQIPADAVSGQYFAKLVRDDVSSGGSHIYFVVRDDSGNSDILFQGSDTTVQAYNNYGGWSLYQNFHQASPDRAYKVSFNRPTNPDVMVINAWNLQYELPMIKFLEANGYDVSYFSGVDTDRYGNLLQNHKMFMSVGHDEYWSGMQRRNVENARDNGVNLAFFSGNEMFWKTRYENSIDGADTSYRTLVTYKETHDNAKTDPSSEWTGTWRDQRFSPPADAEPENALTGTLFMVNSYAIDPIHVSSEDGKMRFWRNTPFANLSAGQTGELPAGILGFEWDIDADNGFRPAGLINLSHTTVNGKLVVKDYGSTFIGGQTAHHSLNLYKHASGALVFGAGTIGWPYALADNRDVINNVPDPGYASLYLEDNRVKQATVNLLADMQIQPATILSGLTPASASTDTTAPFAQITSPTHNSTISAGPVTVTGTASDTGGGVVGGIEVSYDNGSSWHPAAGRTSWSYTLPATVSGTIQIQARATDDSGNIQEVPAGITVTINQPPGPCTQSQISAVQSSPQPAGGKYQFIGRSTCGGTPEYRWWTYSAATGWVIKQDWSTNNFEWDTNGLPADNYIIATWTRTAGSTTNPNIYDLSPSTPFTLSQAQSEPCNSATITPASSSPQVVGGTYQFTGTSNCGSGALYKFWILPPGGSWEMKQDFSTNNIFNWNTSGLPAGNYQIGVHVNSAAGIAFHSAPALPFALTSPSPTPTPAPCTSASLTANSASPQPKGGTYQFSGSSNCGTGAQYRYWVYSESTGWVLKQDWTTSTTFNWSTTGLSAGNYRIGIHAKSSTGTEFHSAPALPFILN